MNANLPFQIYVIGDTHIRPSTIIEYLEKNNIPFEKISPTFYTTIPAHFDPVRSQVLSKKHLSLSEIGCANSHQLCYKRLLNSESDYALVLEDDAELVDSDFNSVTLLAKKFIAENSRKFESESRALLFYTESANLLEIKNSTNEFFVLRGNASHAMAYLLNGSAALELLNKNANLDYVADWPKGTNVNFYLTKKRLFNHGSKNAKVKSLIETGRMLSKLPSKDKFILNLKILILIEYVLYRKYFRNLADFIRILWWPLIGWQINRLCASSSEVWGDGVKIKKSHFLNFTS